MHDSTFAASRRAAVQRRKFCAAALAGCAAPLFAQTSLSRAAGEARGERAEGIPRRYGDQLYEPKLRQPGKDVMWLPTPAAMVTRMLTVAGTGPNDIVYDLGAGEGRIPIAAAKEFGARAVGIEYDPALAALARRKAERAGVADRVTIVEGDVFKEDFATASVVTLYLLPDLNQQLRPRILRMRPGTRIVSHMWDMGEWEADETFHVGESDGYRWIVPAAVEGRWSIADRDGFVEAEIALAQQFQRVGGTYTSRGRTQPLLGAYVRGDVLGFTFVHHDGGVRSVRARVTGDKLAGALRFGDSLTPVSGTRR